MKCKKIVVIAIISLAMIVAMAACLLGGSNRPAYDKPSESLFKTEVTADSITVIPDKFYSQYTDGKVLEYCLNNGEWQDSPQFTNLIPNESYKINIRVKEDKDHSASEYIEIYVSTTKRETPVLPEKINYTQADKTITIEKNDAWEYCYWGDDNYVDKNSYTYGDSSYGEKTIKVRVKATRESDAGEPYVFKVYISGYYSGSGTEGDPFLVYTVDHFNARSTVSKAYNVYIKLMSDLDFTNATIDNSSKLLDHFDGNGHKIFNVTMTSAKGGEYIDQNYAGIFSQIYSVKNLTVENVNIQLDADEREVNYLVGLIAGSAQVIENCHASGSVVINDGYSKRKVCGVGGLVGEMGTTNGGVVVKNSSADVKIEYASTANTMVILRIGGLFGSSTDGYANQILSMSDSMANIDIDVKGFTSYNYDRYSGIGGLVGDTKEGSIENCYVTGKIKSRGVSGNIGIGGLTASLYASYESYRSVYPDIKYCYSTVDIDADGTDQKVIVGGVNPMMHSKTGPKTVDNCLFAGSISITNMLSKSVAGSVFGKDMENVTINDCFHIAGLADYVDVNSSTEVDEATIKSVAWQRDILRLSEDHWTLVEGSLPVLK